MIAFEELVAALDRWRIRNGLPVVTGDVPTVAVAAQAAPAAATWSPPAAPAWAAAPAAAAPAPAHIVGDQSDVLSIQDDDVVEDEYDNDGADFAMGFGAPAPDAEATASGPVPTAPPPAMPQYADSGPYAQPGSGPYAAPVDPYAQQGSGGYAAATTESDPAYDDPAYDPPEGYDPAAYAPPSVDTIDAEADADIIEDATVVGDERPKR